MAFAPLIWATWAHVLPWSHEHVGFDDPIVAGDVIGLHQGELTFVHHQPPTRQGFFGEIEQNNDTDWFNENRSNYEEYVRDPFAALLEDLTDRLGDTELPVKGSSTTMFRINRDLRFTDDKRPYSESVSGLMTQSGTKNESAPLLYLHIDANGGRVGGGMHRPTARQLEPIRRRIVDEPDDFDKVLAALEGHGLDIQTSDQVRTMPRGFAHHNDHRHAQFIRCTQLVAMAEIPKAAFVDDTATDRIVDAAMGLRSLYDFIDSARPKA